MDQLAGDALKLNGDCGRFLLEVDIRPSKAGSFTDPQTSSERESEEAAKRVILNRIEEVASLGRGEELGSCGVDLRGRNFRGNVLLYKAFLPSLI